MPMDLYPGWKPRIRKDPLGAGGYNRLRDCFRWADMVLGVEHLRQAGSVGALGEHNAAEIPREVGSVYMTAGPTANMEDFRYMASVSRSALGTVTCTTDPDIFPTGVGQVGIQLTNMSETGIVKPCVSHAEIVSTSSIKVHSKYCTSALGAGNAWAAEDADFCMALHGPAFPAGAPYTAGLVKQRGNTLSSVAPDWNQMVQSDNDLRAAFLVEHSTAGVHANREVARTWASIGVHSGGGAFQELASSARNPVDTVSRTSIGVCVVTWTNAWSLSAQPFIMPDYQLDNGGLTSDIYVITCPRSTVSTTQATFYIYKYDAGAMTWARADTNFFVVMHGGA